MKYAGICIYITWRYNRFFVLIVVRCTVWCWASLSWHISISRFISLSCQCTGILMRFNSGALLFLCLSSFPDLFSYADLFHHLVKVWMRRSACSSERNINHRAEIISFKSFIVRTKPFFDVITSLNLQVDIPPYIFIYKLLLVLYSHTKVYE